MTHACESAVAVMAVMLAAGVCVGGDAPRKTTILCTTFPIHQITRNVIQGRSGVQLELMLPTNVGCPHDYALTPQDIKKAIDAQIIVANGLGMEEFIGGLLREVNKSIVVVDSSKGVAGLLHYADGKDDDDGHGHGDVNPHLFASPRMAAKIARNIGAELSKIDPGGAPIYERNAKEYAGRLDLLADEFQATGEILENNRIVTEHGVFDYLAQEMGLEIVAVVEAHAGQEPSTATMLNLVKTIRKKKPGAIFIEPQYPSKIAETLARETGVPMASLDPVATGPVDAGLDYYEKVMRQNLETLKRLLGVKAARR